MARAEQVKYEKMWGVREYRRFSPAEQEFENIRAWLNRYACQNVLDLGCGTGRLDRRLAADGFSIRMIDIAPNCLDPLVRDALSERLTFEQDCLWSESVSLMRADAVICLDVLEHIPEEHVDDVCENIRSAAPHGYVNAALYRDGFGKRIGERLHLTLKPAGWWHQKFPNAEHQVRGNDAWMIW